MRSSVLVSALLGSLPVPHAEIIRHYAALVDMDLFVSGKDGYAGYRIPGIVQARTPGTLLAFAEGRKKSLSDRGYVDIILKRSLDNGATWSSQQLVHGESNSTRDVTIGNPAPLVDVTTGRIWLFFAREDKQILLAHSDDDGATWSSPMEMSDALMPPDWTGIWPGLSGGIVQVGTGGGVRNRIMVCANHADQAGGRFSHTIYSDDNGETWHNGASVMPWGSTECNLGQTQDGIFMYTRMWNQKGRPYEAAFGVAQSRDGGVTFSNASTVGILQPHPDVEGTMRLLGESYGHNASRSEATGNESRSVFVLAAPEGSSRANLTLTYACGESVQDWQSFGYRTLMNLWSGPAAYSSIASSSDGNTFFVLYERGEKSPYETLRLTQVVKPACATADVVTHAANSLSKHDVVLV